MVPLLQGADGAVKFGRDLVPLLSLPLWVVVLVDQGKEEPVFFGGPFLFHVFNSKKGYLIALSKYGSAVLFGHVVVARLQFKPQASSVHL